MNNMKPTLFYDIRSPPVRSCVMLIKYLNLDIDFKSIDLFKREHLSPAFLKINPIHTVPTLKDKDLILTDSHSILIHLCEKYVDKNNINLWPKDDYLLRIKIINMLFFDNSILFRRDSDMFMEIFQKGQKDLSHHEAKIYEAYNILETFLNDNRKYIVCDEISIADFSIVTTLSTIDIIFPVKKDKWPKLFTWYEKMKSMPCYKDGNEEGRDQLKNSLIEYANFDLK